MKTEWRKLPEHEIYYARVNDYFLRVREQAGFWRWSVEVDNEAGESEVIEYGTDPTAQTAKISATDYLIAKAEDVLERARALQEAA